MRRPAAVEPVNVILSTPGSVTSSSDTSRSAVTTLSTPGGRPISSADLGEHVALARRLRRRLQHDGAAGEQRGADLVADQRDRRVPRDDRADHADRLAHEQAELAAARSGGHSSSNGNVSASAAYCASAPAPIRPAYCDVLKSAPDSRGHSCAEHVAALRDRRRRTRGGTRRARRGVRRGHGPSSNACRAGADRPRHVVGRRPRRLGSTTSSVPESITSMVASDDGSTHSPPMKKRSAMAHGCGRGAGSAHARCSLVR